jgi:hypothetical protein
MGGLRNRRRAERDELSEPAARFRSCVPPTHMLYGEYSVGSRHRVSGTSRRSSLSECGRGRFAARGDERLRSIPAEEFECRTKGSSWLPRRSARSDRRTGGCRADHPLERNCCARGLDRGLRARPPQVDGSRTLILYRASRVGLSGIWTGSLHTL